MSAKLSLSFWSTYETKIFIELCGRTFETVIQVNFMEKHKILK